MYDNRNLQEKGITIKKSGNGKKFQQSVYILLIFC